MSDPLKTWIEEQLGVCPVPGMVIRVTERDPWEMKVVVREDGSCQAIGLTRDDVEVILADADELVPHIVGIKNVTQPLHGAIPANITELTQAMRRKTF